MKSNLFGKLSAGVAGVALMAIGVIATPVQAATVTVRFQDTEYININGQQVPNSNPFYFKGVFELDTDPKKDSISSWSLASVNNSTNQESGITTSKPTITFNNNALSLIYVIPSQTANNVEQEQRRFTLANLYRTSEQMWQAGSGYSQKLTNGNWQPWANLSYDTVVQVPAGTPAPPPGQSYTGVGSVYYDTNASQYYSSLVVPEPSTYVGTILAFGALGAVKVLKRKQKNKETFTP